MIIKVFYLKRTLVKAHLDDESSEELESDLGFVEPESLDEVVPVVLVVLFVVEL